MVVDGTTIGCSAFGHNIDFGGAKRLGCIWIQSTGILPEFQGKGYGLKQKQWQLEYAKKNGFSLVVTNMRQSNARIIHLNEKLGFTPRGFRPIVPGVYSDPEEASLVMELNLEQPPAVCPKCGKALRTPKAKQCRFCGADWH